MFKKVEIWIVYILFFLFFLFLIGFGSLLRHELMGGKSFPKLSKAALFIAEIPFNIKQIFLFDPLEVQPSDYKDFGNLQGFVGEPSGNDKLLLLSRYDGNLKESVVELVDLNNFQILHSWNPDIESINKKTTKEKIRKEISSTLDLKRDKNERRYRIYNPLLLEDGSLIFAHFSPLVKINKCSEYTWHNDDDFYHHLINTDNDSNIWVTSEIYPSQINTQFNIDPANHYWDDAITKLSKDGKVLYQKSVSEIFIENNLKHLLFSVGIHY